MSNQALNSFEGVTFKVIGQVVDISYHGVSVITHKGNGILGKMMAPLINNGQAQAEQTATTKSSEVNRLTFEEVQGDGASHFKSVRAQLIADNAALNAKVRDFHSNLNSLKEGLLQGKMVNYAGTAELNAVREAMIPHNVGKVVKVKLQARMFSKSDVQSWNRVKTGGSSKVGTLYTMYVPYNEDTDLQQLVDQIAEAFKLGYTGSNVEVKHVVKKTRVSRRDDDQIIIEPLAPETQVVIPSSDGGDNQTLPVEAIRSSSDRIRGSSLFTKKMPTISSDPFTKD